MLLQEQNLLLTQTGPDSDCGQLMRHYWQPVALEEELLGDRPIVPVTVLGERLVLFSDKQGNLGLMDRSCPHRGVDLCYGRAEEQGLRCPFHGWLFAPDGTCLEQPGEQPGKNRPRSFGQAAYPCEARNGIIFAWMGKTAPPPLPSIDSLLAATSHVFAFKGFLSCNYLQAVEVGIDPAHASFLHRFLFDEDPNQSYGQQFRDGTQTGDVPLTKLLRESPAPAISVDHTGYGLEIEARRYLSDGRDHVRITSQLFPHGIVIPLSATMSITQWHVPVDDKSCYWYAQFTSYDAAVDKDLMREQRLALYRLPDYKPRVSRENHWGFDPEEQRTLTYTGMGMDINVHDQWAVESPGVLSDRTREHLVGSDVAIARYRRLLLKAIEDLENGQHDRLPLHGDQAHTAPVWHDSVMQRGATREDWLARYHGLRDQACWS